MADPGLPRSATPPDGGTGSYVFSCQESDFTSKEYRDAIQIRIKNFETQLENKQRLLEEQRLALCRAEELERQHLAELNRYKSSLTQALEINKTLEAQLQRSVQNESSLKQELAILEAKVKDSAICEWTSVQSSSIPNRLPNTSANYKLELQEISSENKDLVKWNSISKLLAQYYRVVQRLKRTVKLQKDFVSMLKETLRSKEDSDKFPLDMGGMGDSAADLTLALSDFSMREFPYPSHRMAEAKPPSPHHMQEYTTADPGLVSTKFGGISFAHGTQPQETSDHLYSNTVLGACATPTKKPITEIRSQPVVEPAPPRRPPKPHPRTSLNRLRQDPAQTRPPADQEPDHHYRLSPICEQGSPVALRRLMAGLPNSQPSSEPTRRVPRRPEGSVSDGYVTKGTRYCPTCNEEFPYTIPDRDFEQHALDCVDRLPDEDLGYKEEDRTCPVCAAHFTLAISQKDFEEHVIDHFADEDIRNDFDFEPVHITPSPGDR